jgi:hypothetical protein
MEPQDIGLEDEFTEDLFDLHDSPWFPGSFHKVTQHTRQEYFFWTNNQLYKLLNKHISIRNISTHIDLNTSSIQ